MVKQNRQDEHRPWGYFKVLADADDYKVKEITVFPGKRLSLQRHRRRSEHWYILSGRAEVTIEGRTSLLVPGQSVDIPGNSLHRIASPGSEEVRFIEVQRGDYFGEDDIERIDDDFGRA